jgi:hypothetical protein
MGGAGRIYFLQQWFTLSGPGAEEAPVHFSGDGQFDFFDLLPLPHRMIRVRGACSSPLPTTKYRKQGFPSFSLKQARIISTKNAPPRIACHKRQHDCDWIKLKRSEHI